jgi:DNA-binding CsgD family transcriptional regulator
MTSREQQAADLYAHGYGLKEVAKMLGMWHTSVRRAAVAHGVEIRPHGGNVPDRVPVYQQISEEARQLYRIHRSKSKLAELMHVGETTIENALHYAGVEMEPAGQPAGNRNVPLKEIREVGLLRRAGKTYAEIMATTGLSESQVRRRYEWFEIEYSDVKDLAHT